MNNCKTCVFWNFEKEYEGSGCTRGIADRQLCDCRLHGPVIGLHGTVWPKTHGDDSCGDHKFHPEMSKLVPNPEYRDAPFEMIYVDIAGKFLPAGVPYRFKTPWPEGLKPEELQKWILENAIPTHVTE